MPVSHQDVSTVWDVALAVLASLGGGGVLVLALSSWLGKAWAARLAHQIETRADRELEQLRADLQTRSERELGEFKHTQALQLEEMRQDASARLEEIRAKLSVERDYASGMLAKLHEVYPTLFERIRIAESLVAGLMGFRWESTYQEYGIDDFRSLFTERGLTQQKSEELLRLISEAREAGMRAMQLYFNELEKGRAQQAWQDARSYLVLKALYCSPRVRDLSHEVIDLIWKAWVAYVPAKEIVVGSKILDEVAEKCDALERVMREELQMRQQDPHAD